MEIEMAEKKIYILDTNVLLHSADALVQFENAMVGIPSIVLEELDRFKREPTDKGRGARHVIRTLDSLRAHGSLSEGVKLDNGSIIRILFMPDITKLRMPYQLDIEDNKILMIAYGLQQEGYKVILISKDLNVRVKADSLGITAEDYLKERVSEEDFYRGWVRIAVPAVELKREIPEELRAMMEDNQLVINEFILVESQHNPHNYRVFRYLGGNKCIEVKEPQLRWPLTSRNAQQLMAMDLLCDKTIQLVSLFGPAGTGKTLLALLIGLHKILIEDEYEKMLIARPVVPLGRDIGFLPGTMEEKLFTWMLPVYDNMEFIMHAIGTAGHLGELEAEHQPDWHEQQRERRHDRHDRRNGRRPDRHHRGGERRSRHNNHDPEHPGHLPALEALIKRGKISLEAITYMRGRSIPYQFIFIDEVQNLTPHEVKTLISRVGEGSKIILAGDPYQIDEPYLDFSSNGLIVASDRFKGQRIFGSVYMQTSVRSELSQLAGQLL